MCMSSLVTFEKLLFPFRNIEEDHSDDAEISNGDDQNTAEGCAAKKVKLANFT